MHSPGISAYVPCYNNTATVRRAVEGVLAQTLAPVEVLVIDDGSTDGSCGQLVGLPVRIIRQDKNLGRGATRARAMREVAHEFVLCCDATNVLEPDFTARALRWMEAPRVAAVFGPMRDPAPRGVAGRWRARHLFKQDGPAQAPNVRALLATGGTLLRKSAVESAGGFNPNLRQAEDADLGARLLAAGCDVVFAPDLATLCNVRNSLGEVLERYWRWNAAADKAVTWRSYAKNIGYSMKSMVLVDLRAGDWTATMISAACPHFQFWKSCLRRTGPADQPVALRRHFDVAPQHPKEP
jgi:GT2 family glycosyltransferase